MITTSDVLKNYGIDPSKVKLVRHGNKEIPILETFKKDIEKFEVYQSYQRPKKYGDASHIAVFSAYHRTTALFLGLWDIVGCIDSSNFTEDFNIEIHRNDLPKSWLSDNRVRYTLRRNKALDDLSERLVIEWGAATVSWVQNKEKVILELKGKQSIGDFHSFSEINMSYQDLQKIVQFPDNNIIWVKALSSVNGVYLIQDTQSGKLYVGSAYGERGIYGRWSNYANSGHGGNLELKILKPSNFIFSILEIVPATTTADGVIECENRWKQKLGTREFGLNSN